MNPVLNESKQGGAVLVAIDTSSCADNALEIATENAARLNCGLIVLHVAHEATGESYRKLDPHPMQLRPLPDVAKEWLDTKLKRLLDGNLNAIPAEFVELLIVCGVPANRICEVAEARSVSMIVLGSHERDGWARLLNGSVAERVMRMTRIPVTVVKAGTLPSPAIANGNGQHAADR